MASIQKNARLFGLDLSGVFVDIKAAWRGMASWRVVSWLRPQPSVRWLRANGTVMVYQGATHKHDASAKAVQNALFEAVEVPEDLLLRRTVRMPVLPPAAMQGALALEAQNLSPFPLEDLLWVSVHTHETATDGTSTQCSVELVLTSRVRLQAYLMNKGCAEATDGEMTAEVWIAMGDNPPAVLPGFGEARRQRHERQWLRINGALLMALVMLAGALLITPTVQLRQQALDALVQYEALQKNAAPLIRQRESLVKNETLLQSLPAAVGQAASALQVMELLTKGLPDDTFLQSFQVFSPESVGKLPRVVIVGQAANAAALMQQLGRQPGVREVKAPNAAIKPLGAAKESFTIELFIDLSARSGDAAPALPAAATASAPATATATAPSESKP